MKLWGKLPVNTTTKQLVFAAFFTFLGAALGLIGIVAFDSKDSKDNNASKPAASTAAPPKSQQPVPVKQEMQAAEPTAAASTTQAGTVVTTANTNAAVNTPAPAATPSAENTLQLKQGTPMLVYQLTEPSQVAAELVPIYNAQNEIDKVAIYTFDDAKNKALQTMFPLPKASGTFPPISQAEAAKKAQAYKPNSYPSYQGKLVLFSGDDTPYYYFQTSSNQSTLTLLVDAFHGDVRTLNDKQYAEEKQFSETHPEDFVSVNAEGLLTFSEAATKNLSPIEQKFIKAQQAALNDMIKQGLVKINDKGQIIENNMTEAQEAAMDKKMQAVEKQLLEGEIKITGE